MSHTDPTGLPKLGLSPKLAALLVRLATFTLIAYLIGSTYFGYPPNIRHRCTAFGLCIILGFVLYRGNGAKGGKVPWYDWALMAIGLASCINIYVRYWELMLNRGSATDVDYAFGVALVLVILEMARRCIDNTFTILVFAFVIYSLFGHMLPGRLGHAEMDWRFLVDNIYVTTNGIWGELMAIFVEVIALFLVFSSVMIATGADRVIIASAAKIGGRYRGGAAKICVLASALIGMISGSSVTNAAMVGNVTIPMMKRMGYRPEVAAGIEATASSGGQITPPMMGAGLFLMAQLIGVDLIKIMLAASIPAFLFYVGVLAAVHFDSVRDGIVHAEIEDVLEGQRLGDPRVWVPVATPFVLLVVLLSSGRSIELSVVAAIFVLIISVLAAARSLLELKGRLRKIVAGMIDAAESLVLIAVLLAASAILVGLMDLSGLGVKLTELTLALSSGSKIGTLLLTGLVVLVLGLGLPTTAAYLIAAAVGAVTLTSIGLTNLQAHMFLFYFAALSAITPPVAPAVLVAAGIANASIVKASIETIRIASIKYVLPFGFAFNAALLMEGDMQTVVISVICATIGAIFLSAAFAGFLFSRLGLANRTVCFIGSALCFLPPSILSVLGVVLVVMAAIANRYADRRWALIS
jgi:TRAP transporter 4TM/12TM fusion protein